MNNLVLYLATVLIWGSTWFAITFQLGNVDPILSVAYRFGLAALLLFGYCALFKLRLRFSAREHVFMLLLGALLFALNYVLFYRATFHITSGLVAVTFSTVIIMNILNGVLFLRTPVRAQVLVGSALGLAGIALLFLPELRSFNLADAGFYGLILCLVATYSASLGNIVSAHNQRRGMPVVSTNAYAMAYGALLTFGYGLASGVTINFAWTPAYLGSLLYLSIFGSIIAFGCYLTLVGRIGADKAAYASLLFPLVALSISTAFEHYVWTGSALAGMVLILAGNVLVLSRRETLARLFRMGAKSATVSL